MNLKDFLHFYKGCRVVNVDDDDYNCGECGKLVSVDATYAYVWQPPNAAPESEGSEFEWPIKWVKPYLRTTQSVTQEEWNKAPNSSLHIGTDGVFYSPELFRYLLSLHVDLFGLIDAGLALDVSGAMCGTVTALPREAEPKTKTT